jgi:hypothetical protein
MIPDALFREFPAKILRKLTVSGRKIPEIRCKGPVTGSVHWHAASTKSQENSDPAGCLADFSTWLDKLE